MPPSFRVGLVQMAMSADPAANLERAVAGVREAAKAGAAGRLPAGAVPLALLLPARGRGAVRPGRDRARAHDRGARRGRAKDAGVAVVVPLFESARPASTTTPRPCIDADGRAARPVPQDAHPGRPALLREVLLHARRPRASARSTRRPAASARSICWDQWYPGGRAPDRARRARRCCSTRPPSAGTRTRRRSTAPPSATPGRPSSASTRSPTACTSRP